MTKVEFMKLKTLVAKNINIKILDQTIHVLHNVNGMNMLFV